MRQQPSNWATGIATITLFVDAVCATLQTGGVVLLNGPIDRPWGPAYCQLQRLQRAHLGDRAVTPAVSERAA